MPTKIKTYRVESPRGPRFYKSVEAACVDNGLNFHTVKKIEGYPKVIGELLIHKVELSVNTYDRSDIIDMLNSNGGILPMAAGTVNYSE